jgi:putative membrane protein
MIGMHGYFAKTVRVFAQDKNLKTAKFYKIINEVPTILMILIIILVVVKPI